MKIHKNIMTLTLILSIMNPIKNSDFDDNENQITPEYVLDQIEQPNPLNLYINSTSTNASILISNELMFTENENISLDQAVKLLEETITDITSKIPNFDKNQHQKLFTPAQAKILSTIISCIINTITSKIDVDQYQSLLEKDGIALLQACAENLTIGSKFTLNGITYTIIAPCQDDN